MRVFILILSSFALGREFYWKVQRKPVTVCPLCGDHQCPVVICLCVYTRSGWADPGFPVTIWLWANLKPPFQASGNDPGNMQTMEEEQLLRPSPGWIWLRDRGSLLLSPCFWSGGSARRGTAETPRPCPRWEAVTSHPVWQTPTSAAVPPTI